MKTPSIEALKKIPMLSRFTNDELNIMATHTDLVSVGKDSVLFNEGDKGDYICFVVDGRLDVIMKTWTGEEIVLHSLSRGQSFGEMSIIENSPRSATVRATTDVTYFTLTRQNFESIMENHPDIGSKILKGISLLLSKYLRQTSSRLVSYMSKKR